MQPPNQFQYSESPEDLESRRTKRILAVRAFYSVALLDAALIAMAIAFPSVAAAVAKLEFLVATLNAFCGGVVSVYMGFSFQAQWRNRSYLGAPGVQYTGHGSPYGHPGSSPYGQPGSSLYGHTGSSPYGR